MFGSVILESPVNGMLFVSESHGLELGSESAYVKLLKVSLMFISVGSKRDRSCSVNGLTRTATVIDDCLVSGIFDVDCDVDIIGGCNFTFFSLFCSVKL